MTSNLRIELNCSLNLFFRCTCITIISYKSLSTKECLIVYGRNSEEVLDKLVSGNLYLQVYDKF